MAQLLVSWENRYSLGIKEVDDQHYTWFEIINELHQAMCEGKAQDILAKIFQELIDFTENHFSFEEKYMLEHGYMGYPEHKSIHENFRKKIRDLQDLFDNGVFGVDIELMSSTVDWLKHHILEEDKKYADAILSKSPSSFG